ncbi:MAG: 60S ribosomal protein L28 [Candidatus Heimdallarchaeota archaeon]
MQNPIKELVTWKTIEAAHCAFRARGPNGQELTCGHLFNVEPKCAGNLCPIANSNYLTFQREETTLFMVGKQAGPTPTSTQTWTEVELQGTKEELVETVEKKIEELSLSSELATNAKRKFERLYELVTEIKVGLEQAELPDLAEELEEEEPEEVEEAT